MQKKWKQRSLPTCKGEGRSRRTQDGLSLLFTSGLGTANLHWIFSLCLAPWGNTLVTSSLPQFYEAGTNYCHRSVVGSVTWRLPAGTCRIRGMLAMTLTALLPPWSHTTASELQSLLGVTGRGGGWSRKGGGLSMEESHLGEFGSSGLIHNSTRNNHLEGKSIWLYSLGK